MTKQEYNRDVKRLHKAVQRIKNTLTGQAYFDAVDRDIKPEFLRLYRADSEFTYANKQSIITLLSINHRYRWIPLHSFGLMAKGGV